MISNLNEGITVETTLKKNDDDDDDSNNTNWNMELTSAVSKTKQREQGKKVIIKWESAYTSSTLYNLRLCSSV